MLDIWNISINNINFTECKKYIFLLDTMELMRINRCRFVNDREMYTICHVAKRLILSQYVTTHPQNIQFTNNDYGKPYLLMHKNLYFNISHSIDKVLMVVSDTEVGIDIEKKSV